jgi:hypothetical protein
MQTWFGVGDNTGDKIWAEMKKKQS